MTLLLIVLLLLAAAVATAVVLVDDTEKQAIVLSALGLVLTVLFVALQAPDVALSELAVGAAVVPLLMLLTIRKIRRSK